ncbi:putative trancriptional regulator, ArsR family [Halanaeroarchaeum sp. HSR-CO]|uniref:DUF7344 domain-containing protein n=1 Tax=Halanaeroarchaeum sp. HSR-CO TaxID=2866382 RepID=UPI00217D8A69|nr:hypothetical protein [Halanaeroarchaeum sp. HSR-CO]UWG46460.1 putative trancriptional regulator, ArsR family [Halanaeroarchaeum sp. HSR-CO]
MSTTTGAPGGAVQEGPSEDDLFEILSNRRRRYVVHALEQADEPMQIGEVAERVAAWEYDVDESELSYDERKRVYTALQQSHLPKMDDIGIVEYDKNRGTIEPQPGLAEVDVYIDVVSGREIPWSQYYLGLAGLALALVAAVGAGLWPLEAIPEIGWMAAITVSFGVSAAIHAYFDRTSRLGAPGAPPERLRR